MKTLLSLSNLWFRHQSGHRKTTEKKKKNSTEKSLRLGKDGDFDNCVYLNKVGIESSQQYSFEQLLLIAVLIAERRVTLTTACLRHQLCLIQVSAELRDETYIKTTRQNPCVRCGVKSQQMIMSALWPLMNWRLNLDRESRFRYSSLSSRSPLCCSLFQPNTALMNAK